MTQRTFLLTAAVIFPLIALGHLIRIVINGTFVITGVSVPIWVSGVAVVIMAYLAYQGFRLTKK